MEEMKSSKGLWDCPRSKYSKETQELIQVMMRESRLTNLQQRRINNQLKKGGALPMACNTSSSPAPAQPVAKASKGPVLPSRPQRRSAENCRAGDSYTPERFRPSATRDLEKEKRRLQNILATGQEDPQPSPSHTSPDNVMEDTKKDRFQEVLDEIEERRQFLEEMTSLGRGSQYRHIINSEISQKIRELELIDRSYSEAIKMKVGKREKGEEQQ